MFMHLGCRDRVAAACGVGGGEMVLQPHRGRCDAGVIHAEGEEVRRLQGSVCIGYSWFINYEFGWAILFYAHPTVLLFTFVGMIGRFDIDQSSQPVVVASAMVVFVLRHVLWAGARH